MKTNTTTAVLLFSCFSVVLCATSVETQIQETHTEAWTYFVAAKCKEGSTQMEVDAALAPVSTDQIVVQWDGSGHYSKYYAIDDFVQVAADFDPKMKLRGTPRVIPRTKWRRYPSGQGWVATPDGATVDPKDGAVLVP